MLLIQNTMIYTQVHYQLLGMCTILTL